MNVPRGFLDQVRDEAERREREKADRFPMFDRANERAEHQREELDEQQRAEQEARARKASELQALLPAIAAAAKKKGLKPDIQIETHPREYYQAQLKRPGDNNSGQVSKRLASIAAYSKPTGADGLNRASFWEIERHYEAITWEGTYYLDWKGERCPAIEAGLVLDDTGRLLHARWFTLSSRGFGDENDSDGGYTEEDHYPEIVGLADLRFGDYDIDAMQTRFVNFVVYKGLDDLLLPDNQPDAADPTTPFTD